MKTQISKQLLIFILFFVAAYSVSAACTFDPASKNTNDFLNEISSLNTQLQNCPVPLDSTAKRLLGSDEIVKLTILRSNGDINDVYFTITGGAMSGVSTSGSTYGFNIIIEECSFDAILGSSNRYGAFAYVYTQKKAVISAAGFWNKVTLTVAKLFINGAMKKSAVTVSLDCLKADGAVCDHGGQCKSGNCVGVGQGPPWTYMCSCDPTTFKTSCPAKPTPQTDANGLRPPGELCDHGGQCRTGNCVGVGQGPPWTYRCSCSTSTYTTNC